MLEANVAEDPAVHGDEFFASEGSSYGLDLLARMQRAGVSGWIAYTYGVSSALARRGALGAGTRSPRTTSTSSAAGSCRDTGSARGSGSRRNPYTPIVGEIARRTYDPSTDRSGTGQPQRLLESLGGARNGARFPTTERLDLDVSRMFRVRRATVSPYVSVLDTFNSKNVLVYLYHYSVAPPTRRAISQFPILPSAGVRVEF